MLSTLLGFFKCVYVYYFYYAYVILGLCPLLL